MASRSTVCGVQVHTWGTSHDGGTGVSSQLEKGLYGGDPGHAAMTLVIPDNHIGGELIKKYCIGSDGEIIIPHVKHEVTFADGTKEKVYEVYFSAWPSNPDDGIYLENSIDIDQVSSLYDENFNWDENFKNGNDKYIKNVKGGISSKNISRGPITIQHLRMEDTLNLQEKNVLAMLAENVEIGHDLENLCILNCKIKDSLKLEQRLINSHSKKLLMKNTIYDYPHFADLVTKEILRKEDLELLLEFSDNKIKLLQSKIDSNNKNIAIQIPIKNDIYNINKKHLSSGAPESGSVSLPINNKIASDVGMVDGLDVEGMLIQMRALATGDIKFSLVDRNCAECVATVLEAGVTQTHLKSIIAERAIFKINTPQMLYNMSLRLQEGIMFNEKTNTWHKMQYLNLAAPIRNLIKLLIKSGYDNPYLSVVLIVPLIILLIPLLVVKAFVWPFNMLGGFLAKERRAKIVNQDNAAVDVGQTGLSETEFNERKIIDSELKSEIEQKLNIKQIDSTNPETAILDFAKALSEGNLIPVFINKDVDKLKKYIYKHETTPENLKNDIVRLGLSLPKDLNYDNLSDLVDALQLLSASRVTADVARLHDVIKNRKTTDAKKFEASRDSSTTSIYSDSSKDNNNPPSPKKGLDDV